MKRNLKSESKQHFSNYIQLYSFRGFKVEINGYNINIFCSIVNYKKWFTGNYENFGIFNLHYKNPESYLSTMAGRGRTSPTKNGLNTPYPVTKHEKPISSPLIKLKCSGSSLSIFLTIFQVSLCWRGDAYQG